MIFNYTTLHHAYIIEILDSESRNTAIDTILQDLSIEKNGNPDLHIREFETFGIDDARDLVYTSLQKSIAGDKHLFFLNVQAITTQAQNALLKVLEEPVSDTHFFIIVPSASSLLPTLLSRCHVIISDQEVIDSKHFLKSSYKERLKTVGKLIEDKNASTIKLFMNALEKELHSAWSQDRNNEELKNALKEITMVQGYLMDQGASYKFLLEHCALVIPRIHTI